jgi:two-component system nitrogen regulation response regulator GlnG
MDPLFGSKPLLDPYLSRSATELILEGERAAILPGTTIKIDGMPISGRTVVSLDPGAVIEVGDRVVLLLHRIETQRAGHAPELVGASAAVGVLRGEISRAAPLEVPVLLTGETGTGKELVAQQIHRESARRDAAWVAVSMAAIQSTVAASALFGHEKGAFTGATEVHDGYFGNAHGGTLFLDEIGETSLEVQAMLLRALESGSVQRVGGTGERPVDVRLIAATDRDLRQAVRDGTFRSALLHRLMGWEICVPPLRERRDDIARLAVYFARNELERAGETIERDADRPWLPASVVARLVLFSWPGNVRQLKNVVRKLVLSGQCDLERVLEEDRSRTKMNVGSVELEAALSSCGWKIDRAAKMLGMSRASIYRRIEAHPTLRTAKDLTAEEIEDARSSTGGDLEAMSNLLRVSVSGIRQRQKQLGL